jgi:hypothetical protein
MTADSMKSAARHQLRSRPMQLLARAGFAVNGLVHAIIGVLAISVAFGAAGQADQGGALGQIASSPGGVITLWVVTVALAALGLWIVVAAFLIPSDTGKRRVAHTVIDVGKGLAYLLLAGTALAFALGNRSNSEAGVDSMSATLISMPGGVILLTLVGLLVLVIGGYFVVKGVKRRFVDDIALPSGKAGNAVLAVGTLGYIAKGIALAFMGVLLGIAALTADPSQAAGLDGSLRTLAELPLGKVILVVIGLGFIAYGVYCCVRARLARL